MIGSSQGGQPPATKQGVYNPSAQYSGYSSRDAFEQAGAPKSSRPQPQPLPSPPSQNSQVISAQSSIRPPQYISDDATESSVNNVMALGYQNADQRYQMKQLDRPGLRRGKGSQYIAGQQGVQEMGKAAANAAGVRAQDQMQNAQMKADYEKASEQEAQSLAMTANAFDQADWNRWFAQMQAMARQQQAASQLMASLMS